MFFTFDRNDVTELTMTYIRQGKIWYHVLNGENVRFVSYIKLNLK